MNRRIIVFLAGIALGDVGGTSSQVAVFWTALSITGSAISVGSLGGVWTFSMAVMNLISGAIVDRFNRKVLLIIPAGLLGVVSLTMFALATSGALQIWHLWLFLIAEAVLEIPAGLSYRALLPDIANKDVLLRVNGAMSSWGQTDNLVEAALAGIILKLWGPGPIFLINAITYFLGAMSPLFIWRLATRAKNHLNTGARSPTLDLQHAT